MKKVTPNPSCLAQSADDSAADLLPVLSEGSTVLQEGCKRVHRSAAMLGLAISMGTTSLLFANQSQPAMAETPLVTEYGTDSVPQNAPNNQSSAQEEETSSQSKTVQEVTLATPAIKHEVKPGESLWQLSQKYKIGSGTIAAINNIPSQANLHVGQSLKIPSLDKAKPVNVAFVAPSSNSEQLDSSLDNLRETRKRLQESLGALRQNNQANTDPSVIITETPTGQTPQTTALSPEAQETQAIDIPVETPVAEPKVLVTSPSESSIPITVPTPETDGQQAVATQPTSLPVPKALSTPLPTTSGRRESSDNTSETSTPVAIKQPNSSAVVPPLPAPRVVTPSQEKTYRVQRGDTLNTIARRHKISVAQLIKANQITDPNLIKVHQQLIIPGRSSTQKAKNNQTIVASLTVTNKPKTLPSSILEAPTAINPQIENPSTETVEIAIESPVESSTDKLRAEVAGLQENYHAANNEQQTVTINIEQPTSQPSAVVGQTRNVEWDKDRTDNVQTEPSRRSTNQEQIIGAAPVNVEVYNDNLKIPVGTTVEPELPPLSDPNQYLPENPPTFTGYIWPSKGVLTSGYGWRWGRPHRGIDIAAPIGTPVLAAASGEVLSAGWNSGGYGNLVKLKHADGSITLYAHNNRLLVRRGQNIQQGQQIAEMGSTGYSTGPHLHFEVHPNGQKAVNPIALLPQKRS